MAEARANSALPTAGNTYKNRRKSGGERRSAGLRSGPYEQRTRCLVEKSGRQDRPACGGDGKYCGRQQTEGPGMGEAEGAMLGVRRRSRRGRRLGRGAVVGHFTNNLDRLETCYRAYLELGNIGTCARCQCIGNRGGKRRQKNRQTCDPCGKTSRSLVHSHMRMVSQRPIEMKPLHERIEERATHSSRLNHLESE